MFDRKGRVAPAALPAQQHSETSVAAAKSMGTRALTLRQLVYAELAKAAMTDEQIAERTGLALNTVRPRRVELVQAGVVIDTGLRSRNHSGRYATVWGVRPAR